MFGKCGVRVAAIGACLVEVIAGDGPIPANVGQFCHCMLKIGLCFDEGNFQCVPYGHHLFPVVDCAIEPLRTGYAQ